MSHAVFGSRAALSAAVAVVVGPLLVPLESAKPVVEQPVQVSGSETRAFQDLRWRNVGPTRGGRVTAIAGVRSQPCTYYMGATGGGMFKTENCGDTRVPISDGQISTRSIGSIDVSESNPNIVYVGPGSAA